MDKKEKKHLELTIKNILYYVDDKKEQEKIIEILKKYNGKFPDSKIKDFFDKIIYSTKQDYFDKIDTLIKDIFENDFNSEEKKLLSNMLSELKPNIDKAERTIWDKFVDLFKWS